MCKSCHNKLHFCLGFEERQTLKDVCEEIKEIDIKQNIIGSFIELSVEVDLREAKRVLSIVCKELLKKFQGDEE